MCICAHNRAKIRIFHDRLKKFCQPLFLKDLIQYYAVKILVKKSLGLVKLFRRVVLCIFELIFNPHCLVFMCSECVVWEDLYPLKHLVTFEMLSQGADVFLEVADSRYEAVSSVLALLLPVRLSCLAGFICFTSRRTRSTLLMSSSTCEFQTPPFVSIHMCIPSSCSLSTSGIRPCAWLVGSPPEKVTPPFLPKNGFWLTAILTISSVSVGVPPSKDIVSGFAQ